MNTIMWAIVALSIVILTVLMIISNKKNKNKINKAKEDKTKLAYTLRQTKQHLKYKKAVTIQTLIAVADYIFVVFGITLFIFLPIFELKIELLDKEIYTQSFSYYDAFAVLKDEYNESLKHYTDISKDFLSMALILPCLGAIIELVVFYPFALKSTMSSDERTFKLFTEVKINSTNNNPRVFNTSIVSIVMFILVYGMAIGNAHNVEYKFISDIPYTIETVGRYSYYYIDGNIIFRVYQNNFVFWNGVSGLIAIPILCFVGSIALLVINYILTYTLKKEILKEEIINA